MSISRPTLPVAPATATLNPCMRNDPFARGSPQFPPLAGGLLDAPPGEEPERKAQLTLHAACRGGMRFARRFHRTKRHRKGPSCGAEAPGRQVENTARRRSQCGRSCPPAPEPPGPLRQVRLAPVWKTINEAPKGQMGPVRSWGWSEAFRRRRACAPGSKTRMRGFTLGLKPIPTVATRSPSSPMRPAATRACRPSFRASTPPRSARGSPPGAPPARRSTHCSCKESRPPPRCAGSA